MGYIINIYKYLHSYTHIYKCMLSHNIKCILYCGSQFKKFGGHNNKEYWHSDRDNLVERK